MVVVADSLWSVEEDGAKKTVVVSLRKAVPDLWTRLLASDEEAEAPRLLDGLERKAPTKAQMLKDAKGRAKAQLDGPSKAVLHTIEGKAGESLVVAKAALPELPVLILRQLDGCTVRIAADVAAIKLQARPILGRCWRRQARAMRPLRSASACPARRARR